MLAWLESAAIPATDLAGESSSMWRHLRLRLSLSAALKRRKWATMRCPTMMHNITPPKRRSQLDFTIEVNRCPNCADDRFRSVQIHVGLKIQPRNFRAGSEQLLFQLTVKMPVETKGVVVVGDCGNSRAAQEPNQVQYSGSMLPHAWSAWRMMSKPTPSSGQFAIFQACVAYYL